MISEISREQAIPKKFLEQILLELKRAGIVMSRRGRLGGYVLLRAPEQVTFGEVLRLIDGPIAPLPCLSKIAYRRCVDCADEANLRNPPRLRPRHHRDPRSARPHHACRTPSAWITFRYNLTERAYPGVNRTLGVRTRFRNRRSCSGLAMPMPARTPNREQNSVRSRL
jgi:hypothetical protein